MGHLATAKLFFRGFDYDWHAWPSELEGDCHIVQFHFVDADTHIVNEHSLGRSLPTTLS